MVQSSCWRKIQKKSFRSLDTLCDYLELTDKQRLELAYARPFPLLVPRRLASKMVKGSLEDPLFRQFVPLKEEERMVKGFVRDPVEDKRFRVATRLLRKYEQRALLLTTAACVMNCRFCFRQNFDYADGEKVFAEELEIIRSDTSLREVILSGGDPLSLSNQTLQSLIEKLDGIEHLRRLRIHTRFPVGVPERLDAQFKGLLDGSRLQVYFVVHCNHPLELDEDVITALQSLKVPLLGQTVLLKNVNDDFDTLKNLCEKMADNGVIPYYLHQLDKVTGTAHFEVEQDRGKLLIEQLQKSLSGYAVPQYVKEEPGLTHKTPL